MVILGGVHVRGQKRTGQRRGDGGEDVGAHDDKARVDAGILRRLLVDADEVQALAVFGAVQNPRAQQDQHQIDPDLHRDAEKLSLAEEAEVHKGLAHLGGKAADALVGGRGGHAGDEQREAGIEEAAAQRDHHGLHAAVGHEEAGQRAAHSGGDNGDDDRDPDIEARVAPQYALDDARKPDDGGGLDINAAGDHDKGHKEGDDADADVVDDTRHDGIDAQELGVCRAEDHELEHQENDQEELPAVEKLFQCLHASSPPFAAPGAVRDNRRLRRDISMERRCVSESTTTMTMSMTPVMVLL